MKEKYQCLVSGLAELDMEMKKNPYTLASLIEEMYTYLEEKDIQLLQLLQLRTDIYNMGAFITRPDHFAFQAGGMLNETQFMDLMLAKNMPEPDVFPENHLAFLEYCVAHYKNGKELFGGKIWEDQFLSVYFQYAQQYPNKFILEWLTFEENLRNLQTAILSVKHTFDMSAKLVGESDFIQMLQTIKSKDFGLSGEFDYVEKLIAAMDEQDLVRQEQMLDQIKWVKLEEFIAFNYFSVDVVLAYFVKYTIALRWLEMDAEKGKERFDTLFDTIIGANKVTE